MINTVIRGPRASKQALDTPNPNNIGFDVEMISTRITSMVKEVVPSSKR
jgi:hypothetical protein